MTNVRDKSEGEGNNVQTPDGRADGQSSGNRKVVAWCLAGLMSMSALTAASPTLYKIFCQVTGYGGTTQRVAKAASEILDRIVTVRFDANVSPGLAWKFEPVANTMDVRIGETSLAFFRATNLTDKPLKGHAAFNVAPEVTGIYFNKIECFCFKEQTLQAGQTVEMPVTFYIDPAMAKDRDMTNISDITLSYVFFPVAQTSAVDATAAGAKGSGG